jgi:hypothetical protein
MLTGTGARELQNKEKSLIEAYICGEMFIDTDGINE